MLHKLFFLEPGELKQLLPFFGLYLMVFTMLNIGDGLSLALFVQRVGAGALPQYYGVTAVVNLALVALYLRAADRWSNVRLFQWILGGSVGAFLLAWGAIVTQTAGPLGYGVFFISREISFTLVLMHFGTFLQDYFTRDALNRVLPIIYSAGRVGGILGGVLLGTLSHRIGTLNLALVYCLLGGVVLGGLQWIQRHHAPLPSLETTPPANTPAGVGFFQWVWGNPLLRWLSITSIVYILCRWVLNYQYNHYFETHFVSDAAMASFLGWYSAVALTVSLFVQLFIVNRLIARLGLAGAHCLYTVFLLGGMVFNLLPMTLGSAVFSRLMETELRSGFRNPITMLMTNRFVRQERTRARGWLMGTVVPIGTLLSAALLQGCQQLGWMAGIPALGATLGLAYFLTSFGLYNSLKEDKPVRTKSPV